MIANPWVLEGTPVCVAWSLRDYLFLFLKFTLFCCYLSWCVLNGRGWGSNRRLWPLFSWFFLIRVCTVERESYLCGKRLSLRQVVGSRSILYREKKECFKEMKGPERKGGRKPGKTASGRWRFPLGRTPSSLVTSPTPQRPPAWCPSPGRSPGR